MQEYQVTLEGETLPLRRGPSWCWRRRTRSTPKAPTRCPRRSSTASCCKIDIGYPAQDEESGDRACAPPTASAGDQLPLDARAPSAWTTRTCSTLQQHGRAGARRRAGRRLRGAHRARHARRPRPGRRRRPARRDRAGARGARRGAAARRATSSRPTTSSAAPCRRCATACCWRPMRSSKAARVDELLRGAARQRRGAAPVSRRGMTAAHASLPTRAARAGAGRLRRGRAPRRCCCGAPLDAGRPRRRPRCWRRRRPGRRSTSWRTPARLARRAAALAARAAGGASRSACAHAC